MALETGSYLADLNTANPAGTDPKAQGDDHIRLVKTVLKNSFAGFPGAVVVTGAETQGASANDYVVTVAPAPAVYSTSMVVVFKAAHANTGAATLKVNALAAKALKDMDGGALAAGDIPAGGLVAALYDGTDFLLLSGNDRAARGGETYTGAHDFTAAAPSVPTKAAGDNSTSAASTAYVDAADALKAPLASPALTGVPTAPTAAAGTNSTQIATTAFATQLSFQAALPVQAGNGGKFLQTDGANAKWQDPIEALLYGDGSDGDVTVTGATTLTRDMHYNNLTISGPGSIKVNGYRVFVRGTLDLTAAGAGALKANGGAGGTGASDLANTGLGGAAGSPGAPGTIGVGGLGPPGANADTGLNALPGSAGEAGQNGGAGGGCGVGRGYSSPSGDTAAIGSTGVSGTNVSRLALELISQGAAMSGGSSGAGGNAGGGGTAGRFGGGGGGSGAGGGILLIASRNVVRSASTAASALQAKGGDGGAGGIGNTAAVGGTGGGGGGGGWVVLVANAVLGATATNAIDVTGGKGGNGGNSTGGAFGGNSGGSGASGRYTFIDVGARTFSDSSGASGVVPNITSSSSTGAVGPNATVTRYSL